MLFVNCIGEPELSLRQTCYGISQIRSLMQSSVEMFKESLLRCRACKARQANIRLDTGHAAWMVKVNVLTRGLQI
jgi:hypothetical protein